MSDETLFRIEPCSLNQYPASLADVITDVVSLASELGAMLPPRTAASLAGLVRVVNCYYSNVIEGHNARPREIERALASDFDADLARRDLQLEARAHIRVQAEVDALCAAGTYGEPASAARIRWLHRAFYQDATLSMLRIEPQHGDYTLAPGEFRTLPENDVAAGRHQPPSSHRVEAFMTYFEARYRFHELGRSSRLVAMAAAHHRLNYIHPFVDGNGRVSRSMSHAMSLEAGIGAHGLWSISRGLARGLADPSEYKA
ncbi:MAG: hypothetical protein JWN04_3138 [Myxococcaceae bacterium]|nr:hypothetical protein [Myxococcaceae bacterium]